MSCASGVPSSWPACQSRKRAELLVHRLVVAHDSRSPSCLAQPILGQTQPRSDRLERGADEVGGFRHRVARVQVEGDDRPLVGRQLRKRRAEGTPGGQMPGSMRRPVRSSRRRDPVREDAAEPGRPGAADPDGFPDDDPIEPRPEAPIVTETRPSPPCLLERHLDRVRGIRPVTADQASETNESVVVLDDKLFQGCVDQVAGSGRAIDVHCLEGFPAGHLNRIERVGPSNGSMQDRQPIRSRHVVVSPLRRRTRCAHGVQLAGLFRIRKLGR